ncbi:MAG: hypothetical protein M3503_07365 [Actinomycetota bacterium]|nr:hypothetical protein [Actinomycetota bacterium]
MTGIVAVVVGFAVLLGVSVLSSSGNVDIRLGDERFPVGQTERLASRIAEDRRPFLFSDVSGAGTRDIYLQHLGETPEVGWLAFAAQAPGRTDRRCVLDWDLAEQELVDPCDGTRYPGDGTGLTRYPVEVVGGQLYVDLRPPQPTTSAP